MSAGVSGVSSNNVFVGPVRKASASPAVPVRSVFILETTGYQPHEYLGGGQNTYKFSEVQIRIRGNPNDYLNTRTLANAVWLKCQRVSVSSLGSTTSAAYVRIVNLQSGPMYLGVDELERDEFTINVRCENQ